MLLEVKNLDAGYGYLQILRSVSLNIDKGEYVCIIGPNGAGKSTTMKSIIGLISPMGGSVVFNGEDITGMSASQITTKGISFVSEEMNLFVNMSVQENLYMGAYTIKDKKVQKNRLDFVFSLFPRLAERKDQLAGTMSGGERKKIELASILAMKPKLVMLDEPDSGIDVASLEKIFEAIKILKEQGTTVILITHSLAVLKRAEYAFLMCNGMIVDKGSVEKIIPFFEGKCMPCEHKNMPKLNEKEENEDEC